MIELVVLIVAVLAIDVLAQRWGVDSRLDRGDWQPRTYTR